MVGCSGGGRLNVVVGVQDAIVGGAEVAVSAAAGTGVPDGVAVVVIAVGATARAGPDRLLKSQYSSATMVTAATATLMAMVVLRRDSSESPSKLIAEFP